MAALHYTNTEQCHVIIRANPDKTYECVSLLRATLRTAFDNTADYNVIMIAVDPTLEDNEVKVIEGHREGARFDRQAFKRLCLAAEVP